MGYAMSRLEIESELFEGGNVTNEAGCSNRFDKPFCKVDHEIAQLTNLKSVPNERLHQLMPGKKKLPVSPVKMLAGREADIFRYVDQMTSRAYVSQFSADGSLFVAGFQGSDIRIYNVDRGWKVQKNILAKSLLWTVTDTSLSPDQRHLVYTSMSPIVHIVNVRSATRESLANITEVHEGLDFSAADGGYSFGIFSVKFSTDGRELVAGSSDDSIYIYDLEANKLSLLIAAHLADVNTVTFADESGNLIYSGSDDNLCKVWGRRCFVAKDKPAGDGRYFISNGKDQTIKLWDTRKMSSNTSWNYDWDYRWMDYPPQARNLKHPSDQSIATYKVHLVLRTLIRCYFSPGYSTGQKYIYTGSHDSRVTGAQVAVLKHHTSPVRDCSWHPYYPMLWEFPGSGEAPTPVSKKRIRRRYYY
ncbi:hypothetical protein V6Z11_D08G080900 [Gossypium hirsutum]